MSGEDERVPGQGGMWLSSSVEETLAIGAKLAAELLPDRALLLVGELGSGKTVLSQGVARGLGLDPREIQSPTYTLVNEHESNGRRFVHVDLYRLEGPEIEAIGLEETLAGPGVKVVEWADRLPFPVPGALRLLVGKTGSGGRTITET